MINFAQVYEGWRNMIIPSSELKETINKVSNTRMKICNDCPYHSKNHKTIRPDDHCVECGCMLKPKSSCMSCECPKKYWLAELDNEQEEHYLKTKL